MLFRSSGIWDRLRSDDATRLRLKYDAYYHIFDEQHGTRVKKDGKEYVMLSSNDYLGMSKHPDVIKASSDALVKFGLDTTGARILTGSIPAHFELESLISKTKQTEDTILFNSGFMANLALMSILKRTSIVFVDRLIHVSVLEGLKLSKAKKIFFDHNDTDHLEKLLSQWKSNKNKFIVEIGRAHV